MAVNQLRMDSVDVSWVIVDATVRTGVTVVLSTGRERAYATYLGSMAAIEPDDVRQALELSADHLHVGSYYLQTKLRPSLPSLFAEAHDLGLTTSIDPGWDSSNQWQPDIFDVLSYTDLFLPNEVEALTITGTDTIEEALDVLAPYDGMTVIKMGGKGCLVRHQSRTIVAPSFPVEVVDVTSAGDVFNAGFLYGYLEGWSLNETARFANACGAIAVTRVGSLGLVSGVEEVQAFLTGRGDPPLSEGVE
jgi:sugar/nucleoside kinase (ribokinase family)